MIFIFFLERKFENSATYILTKNYPLQISCWYRIDVCECCKPKNYVISHEIELIIPFLELPEDKHFRIHF